MEKFCKMITYIFHNETRNQVASTKLFINPDEIMNSLFSGAYFRALIKGNNWDKKDIISAVSDNEEMLTLVYENDEVVFCDNPIHIENAVITLSKNDKIDLNTDDNLIVIKCEEEDNIICDCGTSSEAGDFYDNDTEIDSENEDKFEDEDEFEEDIDEEDIEEYVWELRRKMTGLKNITKEKIQEVRNTYFKLASKNKNVHMRVELGMDILKYLWKLVIREFITQEHFEELCLDIFSFIEKKLDYIDSYMRVEYDNFREDILKVSSN